MTLRHGSTTLILVMLALLSFVNFRIVFIANINLHAHLAIKLVKR